MPSPNHATPSQPAIHGDRAAGEGAKEHAQCLPDGGPATFGINNWDDLLAYCYAYLLHLQGVTVAAIEADADTPVAAEILNFMVMWEGRPMPPSEATPVSGQAFTASVGTTTWCIQPTSNRLAHIRFHDRRGSHSVCAIIAKSLSPGGEVYGRITALFRSHPGLDARLSDSREQGAAGLLQAHGTGKTGLLFLKPPAPTVLLVKELSLGGECLAAEAGHEQSLADFL